MRGTDMLADMLADMVAAVGLLTRLPVRHGARPAAAGAWAWPVVGLGVGALSAAGGGLALALGLSPAVAAGLALALSVLATGALHEDGLADSADGLWGGAARERRLAIMRDSRIGAYGVIALILVLGLRWAALAALAEGGALVAGLLASAVVSRAAMAGLMAWLEPARADGLARHTGRPTVGAAALGGAAALLVASLALGPGGAVPVVAAASIAWAWGRLARAKIGGQTGDVLGAGQVLSEAAFLVALSAAV